MLPIFDVHYNTWYHDIFVNSGSNRPPYFHIFIETNSRYAVAIPTPKRDANCISKTLTNFINTYHPTKLTSDCEKAFRSKKVLDLLRKSDIMVRFVSDHNHSALGLIDRLIRTIRDSKPFNEPFTKEEMQTFLEKYNNRKHSATGCSPKEMYNDKTHKLENDYITKKCLEIKSNVGLSFKSGDKVVILKQYNKLDKHRTKYTVHSYIVRNKVGGNYAVAAADDTYILVPFWRMKKAPNKAPLGMTMNDFKRDGIEGERINETITKAKIIRGKIVGINTKNKKYIIQPKDVGDNTYEISQSDYRGNFPLTPTLDEKRFLKILS